MDLKRAIEFARVRTEAIGRPDLLPLVKKCLRVAHVRGSPSDEYALARLVVFRVARTEELREKTRVRLQQEAKLRETCVRAKVARRQEMLLALGEWIEVLEKREVLSPLIAQVMRLNLLENKGGKEVASLLGVSQDVVYQCKKRGLDRVLKTFGCPPILKECLSVPKGRQKRPVPSVLHRVVVR